MKQEKLIHGFLGDYVLVRQVGQGASGRVFEAQDEDGERLALKLFDVAGRDRNKIARFRNEVKFSMGDHHRNVIRVLDQGGTSGRELMFCVMPCYEKTLEDLFSEDLGSEDRLGLFHQAVEVEEAEHLKGVVHRDLKPLN